MKITMGKLGKHMRKELKLGIGVAVLCVILFLGLIAIGASNKNQKPSGDGDNGAMNTQGSELEDVTEVFGTEVGSEESGSESENGEYLNFAIADVSDYVNVRQEPNTDSAVVGKIYDGAVAQILATVGEGENQWFQIVSGNVQGYIKAEFFIHGDEAAAVMDQYVAKYVVVNADRLNVRQEQSTGSRRIGYVCAGEKFRVIENCGEWIHVQYTNEIKGYVSAQYVTLQEDYIYAKNAEDEQAEQAFIKVLKERAGISEDTVKEKPNVSIKPPATTYSTSIELRKAIVDYAMQYLGDRYVHGGQSLATGTDCSGFTMYVLREFGITIGRTPQSQFTNAGRAISYSQIQPGDIICYSSNGGRSCTHVAFYIGDGKILHAANSRDGVKISSATYDTIYGVRNVID